MVPDFFKCFYEVFFFWYSNGLIFRPLFLSFSLNLIRLLVSFQTHYVIVFLILSRRLGSHRFGALPSKTSCPWCAIDPTLSFDTTMFPLLVNFPHVSLRLWGVVPTMLSATTSQTLPTPANIVCAKRRETRQESVELHKNLGMSSWGWYVPLFDELHVTFFLVA